MARQPKKGLSYFPTDVDLFDDFKIMDLLEKYGPLGTTIYQVLLTMVYKNGYYLDVSIERVATTLVRIIGNRWVSKERAIQVIRFCGDIGLIDNDLLSQGVITSVGIQQRYSEVTSRNKSNKNLYWLLKNDVSETPQNVTEIGVSATKTSISATEMQQTKQNETKQNERKENNSSEQDEIAPEPVIIRLTLIDKTEYPIIQSEVDEWMYCFPAVDVLTELKKMKAWCNANPTKRKTLRGIKKFIVTWLSKAQDRGGTQGYTQADKSSPESYSGTDDSEEFLKKYGK